MNLNLLLTEDFNKYAANVTISGLVIVFAMLVLLVVIIALFGKLMSAKNSADKKQSAEKIAPAPAVQNRSVSVPQQDDDELIAVIAAAVDSIYSGSGKKAVIKSVTPCGNNARSAWAAAGLNNNVKAF